MRSNTIALRAAAFLGFLAVALGALGGHALKDYLAPETGAETWRTATLYHVAHAIAMVALVLANRGRVPCWLFGAGIVLFSGSLYGLALDGPRWLGPVTPLGGIAFLVGWAWLVVSPRAKGWG
ncbi:DUF423 domain-containing protein [soil metagenome]